MLNTRQPLLTVDQETPPVSPPSEMISMVFGFLRRHYFTIASVALMVLASATVYVFTTPRSFTAQASLFIDTRKIQVFDRTPLLSEMNLDFMAMESQIQLLKSDNLALSVIKKLHLTEDPEFVGSKARAPNAPSISSFMEGFKDALGLRTKRQSSESELAQAVLEAFQKRLTVTRVGSSSVIEIRFQSTEPEGAAQIANEIGETYIADQLVARRQTAEVAGTWLQNRLPELRARSLAAEQAIVDFKAKNNLIAADGHLISEQQLAELNRQLVAARGRTSEALARLDRIEAVVNAYVPGSNNPATVTDTLNNPIITQLRSKYLEYVTKEADFSTRYGRNHLAAVKLRQQINDIRKSILDEIRRIAETYKSEYEIAKQRQAALEGSLNEAVAQSQTSTRAQVTLRELESSAQRYRTLEDTFLQRYMEAIQQQSFPIAEARFISRASPPLRPNGKRSLILALAAAGGLAFGVAVGVLRETMDRAFRTSRQVRNVLQTDCVAILPKQHRQQPLKLFESIRTTDSQVIIPNEKTNPIWTVLDSPLSRFSESLRSLKVTLDERSTSNKIVGVTSSLPGEGKSTVAASFALMLAQEGARVMLVDCDLRTASLSRVLTGRRSCGFLDVIAGEKPLKDTIWKEPSTNLAFLPAGIKSEFLRSNNPLSSRAAQNIFDHLRQAYEYIIIDLPPLAPVVDVRSVARFVDFYTLVIEWGTTKIDLVEHAIVEAPIVYEHLLGVVLNKVDIDRLASYEGGRRKYYLNRKYAAYGFMD